MPESGLWEFSFSATGREGNGCGGIGYVRLKIDGVEVAEMYVAPGLTDDAQNPNYGYYPISLTTIQEAEINSLITIEFNSNDCIYLFDTSYYKYTHFTGKFLGNLTPPLPNCEFPGQTFQYPGSCRQYWLCQSDSTVDILDCCPDFYVPDAEACLGEDEVVVDSICPADDTCN